MRKKNFPKRTRTQFIFLLLHKEIKYSSSIFFFYLTFLFLPTFLVEIDKRAEAYYS